MVLQPASMTWRNRKKRKQKTTFESDFRFEAGYN